MLRFVFLFIAATLLWLLVIAFLPVTGLVGPSADVTWAAALYRDKDQAAEKAPAPRVFAVGGSGTLFSLDTVELSRRLGRPVINYGTHAGLGLGYILDRVVQIVRPGDLVLLFPEHELLQQSAEPTQLTIGEVAFYDRGYLASRNWRQRLRYLFGYDVFASLTERLKSLVLTANAGRDDVHLDALGNERGNTVAASRRIALLNAAPVDPSRPVSSDARMLLARFAAALHERQVRLIVLPPVLLQSADYNSPRYHVLTVQEEALFDSLGIEHLGIFHTGFLPREDMYDSIYHANDRGRARYTTRIADLICARLACKRDLLAGSPTADKDTLPPRSLGARAPNP
jgi:hypothetical protein